MPRASGINHIATLTSNMDRTVRFYEDVFEAVVTHEVSKTDDHPWMKVVDIGGGTTLNIFEVPADSIIGERRTIGGRGAVDHFGIGVDSVATFELMKQRLAAAGAQEVGEIQQLGGEMSLFFRDPDGMELEICCPKA
jgi:catechol 2,3-dioxygenase-like lactoylglutathione lyase family enzyme